MSKNKNNELNIGILLLIIAIPIVGLLGLSWYSSNQKK